ncbi:MAG: hypothetical protein D6732_20975 [Methanobacteriota archaeon]|nr:MAG: hypothetical protein D6732_20975 [Euryarchaeota archaeon]
MKKMFGTKKFKTIEFKDNKEVSFGRFTLGVLGLQTLFVKRLISTYGKKRVMDNLTLIRIGLLNTYLDKHGNEWKGSVGTNPREIKKSAIQLLKRLTRSLLQKWWKEIQRGFSIIVQRKALGKPPKYNFCNPVINGFDDATLDHASSRLWRSAILSLS